MKAGDTKAYVRLLRLALLLLVSPAFAMEAPAGEAPEEIIVTGRQTLSQLQVKIELAQDRMFGLFNELNDDDRYDIYCAEETRTGTRISQRVCLPAFLRLAIELNARAFIGSVQGATAEDGASGATSVHSASPQAEITYRYPILKQKLSALVEQNAEFAKAVAEHQELIEEMQRRTSSSSNE
jgi:hypothetical protein